MSDIKDATFVAVVAATLATFYNIHTKTPEPFNLTTVLGVKAVVDKFGPAEYPILWHVKLQILARARAVSN